MSDDNVKNPRDIVKDFKAFMDVSEAGPGIPIDKVFSNEKVHAKMLECAGLPEAAAALREKTAEHKKASFDLSDVKGRSALDGAKKYVEVYKYLRGELGLSEGGLVAATEFILDWSDL